MSVYFVAFILASVALKIQKVKSEFYILTIREFV